MKALVLILPLALVAGCAAKGYWRYVHATNGPEDTQSDLAICEVGWYSTPMAAEYQRQIAATESPSWGLLGAQRNAKSRHIRLCMTALRYKLRWFDGDTCQRGCPHQP